jgi:hypothetical protein
VHAARHAKDTDAMHSRNLTHAHLQHCHSSAGVVLCKLIELCDDDTGIKYAENAERDTFFARDNISSFLDALRTLELIESDDNRFEVEDIMARRNDKIVLATIMKLARKAAIAGTVKAPLSVEQAMTQAEKNLVDTCV